MLIEAEDVAKQLSEELEYVGESAITETELVEPNVVLLYLDNGMQFTLTVDEV